MALGLGRAAEGDDGLGGHAGGALSAHALEALEPRLSPSLSPSPSPPRDDEPEAAEREREEKGESEAAAARRRGALFELRAMLVLHDLRWHTDQNDIRYLRRARAFDLPSLLVLTKDDHAMRFAEVRLSDVMVKDHF